MPPLHVFQCLEDISLTTPAIGVVCPAKDVELNPVLSVLRLLAGVLGKEANFVSSTTAAMQFEMQRPAVTGLGSPWKPVGSDKAYGCKETINSATYPRIVEPA